MKYLLLFVILTYLVFRLLPVIIIRFLSHKTKKFGMFGNKNDEAEKSTSQKSKKKIIHQDEGDYVDFEEIDKKNQEQ
jgi:hypothetical protein